MRRSQPRFAMSLAMSLSISLSIFAASAKSAPSDEPAIEGSFVPQLSTSDELTQPLPESASVTPLAEEQLGSPSTNVGGALPFELPQSDAKLSAPRQNQLAGNRLLASAVRNMSQHRSIVANIRHQIDLFGQVLVGQGTYQQMDTRQFRLLRLELKIPLDDQMTSITQISDARHLWLERTMPDENGIEQTKLSFIDLDKVKRAVADDLGATTDARDGMLLGHGGLPQLMIELERNFAFYEVRAATVKDTPVWITWGQWKPEVLNRLFPASGNEDVATLDDDDGVNKSNDNVVVGKQSKSDIDLAFGNVRRDLPSHVPHIAAVALGRDDLLPYRFEYRRKKDLNDMRDGPTLLDDAYTEPIVTMDLYAIEVGGAIDPTQFVFNVGDRFPEDKTREYLQRTSQAD